MTPRCVCGHSSTSHGRWGADPCNVTHCSCVDFRTEPDPVTASSPSAARAAVDELEGLLAKATPRPWSTDNDQVGGTDLIDAHGSWVVDSMGALSKPDAGLIVAAVNALPHLLAAIKAVDEAADDWAAWADDAEVIAGDPVRAVIASIRAALALAAVDVTETAE